MVTMETDAKPQISIILAYVNVWCGAVAFHWTTVECKARRREREREKLEIRYKIAYIFYGFSMWVCVCVCIKRLPINYNMISFQTKNACKCNDGLLFFFILFRLFAFSDLVVVLFHSHSIILQSVHFQLCGFICYAHCVCQMQNRRMKKINGNHQTESHWSFRSGNYHSPICCCARRRTVHN